MRETIAHVEAADGMKHTEAEKHMNKGHTVIIHVVGTQELTTCQTCKITLRSKDLHE